MPWGLKNHSEEPERQSLGIDVADGVGVLCLVYIEAIKGEPDGAFPLNLPATKEESEKNDTINCQ